MKIAIDARFYGGEHTGLGRYTTNVMRYLPKYFKGETLKVLLRDAEYANFPGGKNIQKIHAEIPHYSLAEQVKLPGLLNSIGTDLLYTFHFNTPILSTVPTIVTVHDLIKSHFTGSDTTTRAPWLYQLKRAGYNQVIKHTLTHALDVIVPSNTVKNNILATFPTVKPELIHPIPEAPDEIFRSASPRSTIHDLPSKYVLFVGNAYPHKNLGVLLDAMQSFPDLSLVIVAKSTPFLERTLLAHPATHVQVLSNLADAELVSVYQHAVMLVTPSLMEGYGLVGLEALMVGTPVVASNIPVYREVYGDRVVYFDPHSASDLVRAISHTSSLLPNTKYEFSRTWDDVAKSIAEVIYAGCASL
jgi:glycosyltransferase involved in cell wall biosynthesis